MTSDPLRLFFALPCPPSLAATICAWRADALPAGKAVEARNLHLTLAFLGSQPASRLAPLLTLAAELQGERCTLQLDRLGLWRGGLLHLAPSRVPPTLDELQQQLHARLLAAGFELEERAFRPHLTLARHYPHPPTCVAPTFDWPLRHFALFCSENDRRGTLYRQLGRWPLRPATPAGRSAP
ncbi:RNA 2',3'-cyclic phosphodiesterase [Pseudomonas sp. SP16.1]|uniref:RNA 2',3'-cyclic phosphodiesterase n=1 Tax=Pseudomonas sp. SP16.1 TaxID=3458854 RepID=UPI004046841F